MASSVLPDDLIMLCILTRLPVKSIIRFKSVCKPWHELLSSPEFIKLHCAQFSGDPKNQSFIVHRINRPKNQSFIFHSINRRSRNNTMSLFSIEPSDNKNTTILHHPFYNYSRNNEIDVVGCCNGLVCISTQAYNSLSIVLWNPALKLFKTVSPVKARVVADRVSLGFGYDAGADDYRVVKINCLKNKRDWEKVNEVEVYSVNSDSWITIDPGFRFSMFRNKTGASVNGIPYWLAKFGGDVVLVCFDVSKSVFKIVRMLTLDLEAEPNVKLVDWNGRLGALCCAGEKVSVVKSLDVWVFDDGEQNWRKTRTISPVTHVEVSVNMLFLFMKNGGILGVRRDGVLFVLDLVSGCVEGLFYVAQQDQSFEVYGYTESLVYIEGMTRVCASRKRKMIK